MPDLPQAAAAEIASGRLRASSPDGMSIPSVTLATVTCSSAFTIICAIPAFGPSSAAVGLSSACCLVTA